MEVSFDPFQLNNITRMNDTVIGGDDTIYEECSICYESFTNKSFINECLHPFCFECILCWTKIKAVCPLCIRPITGILHNIRSLDDYDVQTVDPPTVDVLANIDADFDFRIERDGDSSYDGMESDFEISPEYEYATDFEISPEYEYATDFDENQDELFQENHDYDEEDKDDNNLDDDFPFFENNEHDFNNLVSDVDDADGDVDDDADSDADTENELENDDGYSCDHSEDEESDADVEDENESTNYFDNNSDIYSPFEDDQENYLETLNLSQSSYEYDYEDDIIYEHSDVEFDY